MCGSGREPLPPSNARLGALLLAGRPIKTATAAMDFARWRWEAVPPRRIPRKLDATGPPSAFGLI